MFGTGHAAVTECYNTCFALRVPNYTLLVDGGGGNGILRQIKRAEMHISDISDIFVTHVHPDHLLGIVWVLRMMSEKATGRCTVYGHDEVLTVLKQICRNTLSPAVWNYLRANVRFEEVCDGQSLTVGANLMLRFFDTQSPNVKQYGFKAFLPSGKTLVCLGDAPCCEPLYAYAKGTDWLLCEAFCREADKAVFQPHELHHSTVVDSATVAQRLVVKNLVLYHTEDSMLPQRKARYTEEARSVYSGMVCVPDDLETIVL